MENNIAELSVWISDHWQAETMKIALKFKKLKGTIVLCKTNRTSEDFISVRHIIVASTSTATAPTVVTPKPANLLICSIILIVLGATLPDITIS